MDKKLTSRYVSISDLSLALRDRMFSLFSMHYDCVNRETFDADLTSKNGALMLYDSSGEIQGFSTMLWDAVPMEDCEVVYSGDTIIHPDYWGSRELISQFCWLCGQRVRRTPKPLYWFLISKGHRTYQFLPLFSKRWFPSPDHLDELAARLAATCAEAMFGKAWKPAEGLLRFKESMGQLKPSLAQSTELRLGNRYVQYFQENNPNFASGEELVCMVNMDAENLRGTALRAFKEGFDA